MKIYELAYPRGAPNASWDNDKIESHGIICPLEDGHRYSSGRLNELSVILPSPHVADLMNTWYSEWMLSDRTVEIFASAGLTGYTLRPVHVTGYRHGPKEADVPRLRELVVTGWGGVARPESGMRPLSRCPGCNMIEFSDHTDPGKLFDVGQWDETDFFRIYPLMGYVFVTDRVRQLIQQHQLKYAKFLLPGQLPPGPLDSVCARPLSEILPEPMASEIGKPLGIY